MSDASRETAQQFSRQARAYAESPSHALGSDLQIVADFAQATPDDLCLDIATGPGHTAFRIAERAGFVVGGDIAQGMLAAAKDLAVQHAVSNVAFVLCDVHCLPFAADCFDLVTCRIAPHHFQALPAALADVRRILKSGGRFVLEDSLAPDEPAAAVFLEALETRRDATHVHTLSRDEWTAALEDAGLATARETVFAKTHDFDLWIRRTGLPDGAVREIEADILASPAAVRDRLFDIEGDRVTTLRDRKLIVRAEKS